MRYIGIDVSKATFMVAYPQQNGGYKTREFKNTAKGVHEFIHTLDTDDHCVMEVQATTATYYCICLTMPTLLPAWKMLSRSKTLPVPCSLSQRQIRQMRSYYPYTESG